MERAGRLIGKLKFSPHVTDPETRALAAWKVAAGKKVAAHTRAVALVRGTLVVEVGDYIWQRQLTTLRGDLLKNLAEVLGDVLVTDLDFRPAMARKSVQRAESVKAAKKSGDFIEDPVMNLLYAQSRKSAQRAEQRTSETAAKKKESA